jgi:hypothetical protein
MRAKEFLNEDVPAARTDTEREVAQAIYMEGRCGVLAIAINQANPERYKLGYIYEYNVPGTQDVYLDPDEFDALDPEEQQQVKLETQSWALVHAYVVDQQTKEYIDARGRHSKVPDLNYELNLTRKNVFPATSKDIVDITVDMKWNDATEEWDMVKGIAAWNQLGLDNDIPKALDYAVKYLNIDPGKRSQSTPKKPIWMNPGDPLPPSSPNGTWVILGPYKNVLYRFSAPNEQRARSMKDQWCKENNIDPDSNRFCRLKYDGEVRLGQPIKPRGMPVVENTNQAAVDALMKKYGWSMGRTANGDLAFTWQGSKYEFFGERVRITLPDGKSISVVWNKKPDWQGRGNDELSFAQAVQNKYLTFDLPIWQALNRGQLTDSQAIQKFKAENERQAREAVAQQGVVESLRVDVPNEEWLNDAIAYAKQKSPDRNGLPYMGKTTATVRQVEVPLMLLRRIPGMRNEQQNVRYDDLAAITKIMKDTGKLPIHSHSDEEYKPFINVAYDGSAWVNEGNHRIMAAYRLGWDSLPVEISYFDGGERVESGPMYPGKIGL